MNRYRICLSFAAACTLLAAGLSFAATAPEQAHGDKAQPSAKAPAGQAAKKGKEGKEAAKAKPVDINGASKAELMKLPGLSDADAEKIIAGRPYASKAWLVTHNVLAQGTYVAIKDLVIAKQPYSDGAKNAELYMKKK